MAEENNLLNKLEKLEKENAYLKSLLDKAGISYAYNDNMQNVSNENIFDPNQGARILPYEINKKIASQFFSFFWGRMDVFSKRYQNLNTGKIGYFPQCNNFWIKGICPKVIDKKFKCKECNNRSWIKLDATNIEDHLRGTNVNGNDVIGIYPLFPDGTCRLLVFDFDNHEKNAEKNDFANKDDNWKNEVDALREICKLNNIPCLTERSRSGHGAHVWIFFEKPIEASLARKFGFALLSKGAESVNLTSFKSYDRMLPAQENLDDGEIGNLIALPLQGLALKSGNSAFIDQNWNAYPKQLEVLFSIAKLTKEQIDKNISVWSREDEHDRLFNDITVDLEKPWERTNHFHKEDVLGKMEIVLSNLIYVKTANLKPRIQNQIRKLATFSNPKFYKNKAIGLSNYAESRIVYMGEDDNGYICIPRGLLDELQRKCVDSEIEISIEDKRSSGQTLNVEFNGTLHDNQQQAVKELLKHDCGILSAATAFGKTVTCSNIIAEKKVSTLIILESSTLIEQWEESLNTFLTINEVAPDYRTKNGKIKKRKNIIGIIQGSKDTSNGIIDIAMAGSLCKKGEFNPRLKQYGLVLVDECHHSASETVSAVLKEVNARYVYGVTATPFRGDGMDKIIYMLLGPIRFKYTAKQKAAEQGISYFVVPRFTRVVSPHGHEKIRVNEAYELIRNNEIRNKQIIEDIKTCISEGRTPVVLTKYVNHATELYEKVKTLADKVFLLIGDKSKKEQQDLRKEMDNVRADESMILIATGQLIGEGFNFPRLDTLIMAMPISFKGLVEQYAGRLNRDYPGKEKVLIYDYIDSHIPVFDNMYAKRLKTYKRIGYKLYTEEINPKQNVNAIYDSDSYFVNYENDLQEATKQIVISSPTLGKNKVYRMIRLLKKRQESGVKITIVTWHPDAYKYGYDENRIELMEDLRNAGFHIELAAETCERYAVIDDEIVWYGSMNLLSKDDIEDNIMRVVSKEIAAELLELTFHKDNSLKEYELPIY